VATLDIDLAIDYFVADACYVCSSGILERNLHHYRADHAGFAVPAKTNLETKRLLIVPREYDLLKNATPFGHFAANGETFDRAKFEEGSAGHLTLHIIYTWKRGNDPVHFDFQHHSVNVNNFDPASRPDEYDRAAQIKISKKIMRTFRRQR
jgi:hypothetical protein